MLINQDGHASSRVRDKDSCPRKVAALVVSVSILAQLLKVQG